MLLSLNEFDIQPCTISYKGMKTNQQGSSFFVPIRSHFKLN